MKSKNILLVAVAILLLCIIIVPVSGTDTHFPGGGNGSDTSPFEIWTPSDLVNLSFVTNGQLTYGADELNYSEASYRVMKDISLTGIEWTPIGNSTTYDTDPRFKGNFNGNGSVISNLTITSTSNYTGLFGVINGATISNVTLTNVDVSGGSNVGGLVGYTSDSSIQNSSVSGGVSGAWDVGGLVGRTINGSIENSYATGSVDATVSYVGGLVGETIGGSIENSYATGSVSGASTVGGLVGRASRSSIENSYATGSVTGAILAGGLVGWQESGSIEDSLALNLYVNGSLYVDRVAGNSNGASLTNNFAWEGILDSPDGNVIFFGAGDGDSNDGLTITNERFWGVAPKTLNSPWETFSPDIWELREDNPDYQLPVLKNLPTPDFNASYLTTPYFAGGSGDSGDPYQIATAGQLRNLALLVNSKIGDYNKANYTVTADINLTKYSSGEGWAPIGVNMNTFTGSFSGGGKTITGLYINRSSEDCQGLFGFAASGSSIQNVVLTEVNVTGNQYVGGLIGVAHGSVTNSSVTGNVVGDTDVGGLVGLTLGNITDSSATCTISGNGRVGGLVGHTNGNITGSSAACIITAFQSRVGGLVGFANSKSNIKSSFVTGTIVSDGEYAGGFVGINYGSITDSLTTCHVTGTSTVGGFVGSNNGNITSSSATGNVIGTGYSIGGFAGRTFSNNSNIENSYATGNVNGNNLTGGFTGYVCLNSSVKNSYATGMVTSSGDKVGGFAGYVDGGSVMGSSAFNPYVSGSTNVSRFAGRNNGTLEHNFAWDGMNSSRSFDGECGDNQLNGANVSSSEVWNTFPTGGVWSGWSEDFWKAGTGPRYQLPILVWQTTVSEFDARHLAYIPQVPDSGSDDGSSLLADAILDKYAGKPVTVSDVRDVLSELESAGVISGVSDLTEAELQAIVNAVNERGGTLGLTVEEVLDIVRETEIIITTPTPTRTTPTGTVTQTSVPTTVTLTGEETPTPATMPTQTEASVPLFGIVTGLGLTCVVMRRR